MRTLLRAVVILSAIGVLFAGSVTLRQYVSPASEPGIFSCVGFSVFGISPCPYGLGLFALILVISSLMFFGTVPVRKGLLWLRLSTLAGVAFSGWVAWRELCAPALALGASYWETFSVARVPACVWGFFVFLAVAVLSFAYRPRPTQDP